MDEHLLTATVVSLLNDTSTIPSALDEEMNTFGKDPMTRLLVVVAAPPGCVVTVGNVDPVDTAIARVVPTGTEGAPNRTVRAICKVASASGTDDGDRKARAVAGAEDAARNGSGGDKWSIDAMMAPLYMSERPSVSDKLMDRSEGRGSLVSCILWILDDNVVGASVLTLMSRLDINGRTVPPMRIVDTCEGRM